MILFRILWAIDVMMALIALYFFVVGLGDGTVSSFNIVLWLGLLAGLAVVVFGGEALHRRGRNGWAAALAAVPAVPGVGFALLMGMAVLTGARWN